MAYNVRDSGDFYPATRSEYESIKAQLEYEKADGQNFHELLPAEQALRLKQRMKTYCQRVGCDYRNAVVVTIAR